MEIWLPLLKMRPNWLVQIKVWSSFLCVLALSSVICQPIHLFYSKCGLIKYEKIFNQLIYPREKSNLNYCKQILFLVWTNSGGRQKNVIINNHFAPVIKHSLALKKIKGKRKQQNVANDSFTVKSKAQKTMDKFLLKKPNEQTNYKFEQKKTNNKPIWGKNELPITSLLHQLAKIQGKILDKSINLIENSPMITEKTIIKGSSCNMHHVKPQTISSTLSMKKFKKNIKPKKYENIKTKLPKKMFRMCQVNHYIQMIFVCIVVRLVLTWQSPSCIFW